MYNYSVTYYYKKKRRETFNKKVYKKYKYRGIYSDSLYIIIFNFFFLQIIS